MSTAVKWDLELAAERLRTAYRYIASVITRHTVESWLGAHLGGVDGHLPQASSLDYYAGMPLSQIDPLTRA